MSYAFIVLGIFGLVMSVPTAIILWVKLLKQPGSSLKRYLLVRFGLVKPVMWAGLLLAGIGGHGLLGSIGWVLAGIGVTAYIVLMVIGRMIMRRLTEHQQGQTVSDQ